MPKSPIRRHGFSPDELKGQSNYVSFSPTAGNYPLPQIGTDMVQANPNLCQSFHPGCMNVARMDGSVCQVTDQIDQTNWNDALELADNQVLEAGWFSGNSD